MLPIGLSMNKLALELRVPVTRIADIVNERRGITADTALRLARYFNNTASFWMNLQTRFDLEVAADKISARVACDVHPREFSPADYTRLPNRFPLPVPHNDLSP